MANIGDDNYPESGEKFALVMVIDVSGSMEDQMDKLNASLNSFLDKAKVNPVVAAKADVAIITFNQEATVAAPFSNIGGVPYQNLVAYGSTNMRDAMILANDMVHDRTHDYKHGGIRAYKPWIVLMTDGYPDLDKPVDEIAATIRQREAEDKQHCFALGMGQNYDSKVLHMFTDRTLAIRDWNFDEFFGWLGKSIAVVSQSTVGATNAPLCAVDDSLKDMHQQDYSMFMGTI